INAGARARKAIRHAFLWAFGWFSCEFLLFWRLATLRSLTQCGPPATPRGLWSPSPRRETLELSGYRCANELTHRPGSVSQQGRAEYGNATRIPGRRRPHGDTGGVADPPGRKYVGHHQHLSTV